MWISEVDDGLIFGNRPMRWVSAGYRQVSFCFAGRCSAAARCLAQALVTSRFGDLTGLAEGFFDLVDQARWPSAAGSGDLRLVAGWPTTNREDVAGLAHDASFGDGICAWSACRAASRCAG